MDKVQCPECGEMINKLVYSSLSGGKFVIVDDEAEPEDGFEPLGVDQTFSCPNCREELTTCEYDAVDFLTGQITLKQ